jgi:alanine racemase
MSIMARLIEHAQIKEVTIISYGQYYEAQKTDRLASV